MLFDLALVWPAGSRQVCVFVCVCGSDINPLHLMSPSLHLIQIYLMSVGNTRITI